MNNFKESQKKIEKRPPSTSTIICTMCAIILAVMMLGLTFAKALDNNTLNNCEVKRVADKHHPYQKVCKT
jgi:hypothetical protein